MNFPITQIRFARPTRNIEAIKLFYIEGLSFNFLGEFKNHEGISGIMIGLPDASVHLEFTTHKHSLNTKPPSVEHLLVFYYQSTEAYLSQINQLNLLGYLTIVTENPYWIGISTTFLDPDGWRVVLVNKPSFTINN